MIISLGQSDGGASSMNGISAKSSAPSISVRLERVDPLEAMLLDESKEFSHRQTYHTALASSPAIEIERGVPKIVEIDRKFGDLLAIRNRDGRNSDVQPIQRYILAKPCQHCVLWLYRQNPRIRTREPANKNGIRAHVGAEIDELEAGPYDGP